MSSYWITGQAFIPENGEKYEISFGTITYQEQVGVWTARILVKGLPPSQWIDLDTGASLDPHLGKYVVKAFREIDDAEAVG